MEEYSNQFIDWIGNAEDGELRVMRLPEAPDREQLLHFMHQAFEAGYATGRAARPNLWEALRIWWMAKRGKPIPMRAQDVRNANIRHDHFPFDPQYLSVAAEGYRLGRTTFRPKSACPWRKSRNPAEYAIWNWAFADGRSSSDTEYAYQANFEGATWHAPWPSWAVRAEVLI